MVKKRGLDLFFISTITLLFFLISTGFAQTSAKPVISKSNIKTKPQYIKVLSPNGNETIKKGATYQIEWSSKAAKGSLIIDLLYNERTIGTIATSIKVPSKKFNWKVGKVLRNKIRGGKGYKIAIKTKNGKIIDTSDKPFTIIVPKITKAQLKTIKKQAPVQKNKVANKSAPLVLKKQTAKLPDNSHLPDLIVDKFELIPKYAILGEPYTIKIWFKEYPGLAKSPWIEVVKENTFAPALLRSTRKISIPTQWKSHSPGITINYDAERLIDITVQQKKKLTITLDMDNDIAEKNEGNNIITHDFGLFPSNTKMADLMFYDHKIKKLAIESQYYFKSESPNFQKHVHQPVKIWGYVVNFGNDTARPFKIKIIGDLNRDLGTKFTKIIQINKLIKPNEIYTFYTYITWPTPGFKVCLFELDIDDQVIESNENNNTSVGTCTLRIAE
jgi:hypothetical protein